jgi:CoA-dependent NAD(P)H sulfur oxidoreductase
MPKIVVVGAVAAGTSAASQAKRRLPEAEVVLLERGPFVSYGACGIPYNLQDPARALTDLVAVGPDQFRKDRHVDLRLRHEARHVDAQRKCVQVRDLEQDRDYELGYDALVIATGARATRLPIPGMDVDGVLTLRELTDAEALKQVLDRRQPTAAVLVGAGYIGLELAETLRARGVAVTVLEKGPQVAPGYDARIAKRVREELEEQGVRVEVGIDLKRVDRAADGRLVAQTDRGGFATDLIVIAVGVKPNVELAQAAGAKLGPTGAIAVDAELRTNLEAVWAAGDCAETTQLVSGETSWVPLGTTANKQGKIAGANASGAHERFRGIVGTAAFKVFDLQVARTGLAERDLQRLGLDYVSAHSEQASRASSFQREPEPITSVLYVERGSQRLLGAQLVGRDGAALRIDVYAAALHARMSIEQVEALDLAYAPPFAPVYDPILIAATVARKELKRQSA